MSPHVEVRKTYKLYIGGTFPRSESGRSYAVHAAPSRAGRPGAFLANAAAGSVSYTHLDVYKRQTFDCVVL